MMAELKQQPKPRGTNCVCDNIVCAFTYLWRFSLHFGRMEVTRTGCTLYTLVITRYKCVFGGHHQQSVVIVAPMADRDYHTGIQLKSAVDASQYTPIYNNYKNTFSDVDVPNTAFSHSSEARTQIHTRLFSSFNQPCFGCYRSISPNYLSVFSLSDTILFFFDSTKKSLAQHETTSKIKKNIEMLFHQSPIIIVLSFAFDAVSNRINTRYINMVSASQIADMNSNPSAFRNGWPKSRIRETEQLVRSAWASPGFD